MQLTRLLLVLYTTIGHCSSKSAAASKILAQSGAKHRLKVAPIVPEIMTGEVPANGQPYQIVRVIEYLVPYPYKPKAQAQAPTKTARALPAAAGDNSDSLEIIPAHIERLFTLEPTTVAPIKKKSTPKQTHYLLKVRLHNADICSGALISARLVLTSVHCFPGKPAPANQYKVWASRSRVFAVEEVLLGNGLAGTGPQLAQELALLVLKTPVQDAQLQPVALCSGALKREDNVTIFMTRERLRYLRTTVIANSACKRSYAQDEMAFITENMLCAHNTNKLSDCQTTVGDLLLRGAQRQELCGINIYGHRCVEGALNGDLYADIFKAREFLERLKRRYV